jgi:hypothetical protein
VFRIPVTGLRHLCLSSALLNTSYNIEIQESVAFSFLLIYASHRQIFNKEKAVVATTTENATSTVSSLNLIKTQRPEKVSVGEDTDCTTSALDTGELATLYCN